MKAKLIQIHWHETKPIYSIDFETGPKSRLATAGGDTNVRIWKLVAESGKPPEVEFLSSLSRHSAAVNVVRFCPTEEILASAGDDGSVILWKPTEDKPCAGNAFVDNEDGAYEKEKWKVFSILRGSLSDIYDLAWSPDGKKIITGSIDNTARIWDVKEGKCLHVFADHNHYVQGVAWDPLGQYIVTQSSDRSVHIHSYRTKGNGQLVTTSINKNLKLREPKTLDDPSESAPSPYPPSAKPPKSSYIYHSEMLKTFFRRLSFTPDGTLLLTPAGIYHKLNGNSSETETEVLNTTYVFTRAGLSRPPVLHLPGHKRATLAIRCSPVVYQLVENESQTSPVVDLPYRIVYAVASQDSVLVYDTQHQYPIAMVSNLHYATLTDIAWSSDGNTLMMASEDGFCSMINFEPHELGEPYQGESLQQIIEVCLYSTIFPAAPPLTILLLHPSKIS
ncbi:WD40 repeat-like protein [Basidiobolus meristosporus CBS 931.73]|uniref:WD40 repeat-like protein n=1 Tax=Basidiobolus meristosporus CBS 931.73 TaxID=1314790 RepID=A0A1Y1Y0F2_9FUNG|nr:WD40 repeat-like protein [Basidiobolus meristosporus CBS 931.73]|eukprot:ORX91477.1 WD40 repeat-like protein [Basidiobolus meristosporus CBS 931.73]